MTHAQPVRALAESLERAYHPLAGHRGVFLRDWRTEEPPPPVAIGGGHI